MRGASVPRRYFHRVLEVYWYSQLIVYIKWGEKQTGLDNVVSHCHSYLTFYTFGMTCGIRVNNISHNVCCYADDPLLCSLTVTGQQKHIPVDEANNYITCLLCFSGRIPRLSLIHHSLCVGVVENYHPPPPLTGEQYRKMEPKYPEDGHCQSVLRPRGVFSVPLYSCYMNSESLDENDQMIRRAMLKYVLKLQGADRCMRCNWTIYHHSYF